MKYFQLLIILALATLMSSCATVLTGTTQRVTIDSTPQGADIVIDGRLMGKTPARVRLDRDLNALIDDGKPIGLELDGYFSDGYYIGTDIEPMCILNVFVPPFFAIDAITGAMMRYNSDYYNFKMIPYDYTVPSASNQNSQFDDDSEGEDDYEKLMKLVELYEEGLITEEEFEQEKAKIFKKER